MAEDVCDSWEDLAKSEVLDKKLEQLKLNGDPKKKKKSSPVKILQRPSSTPDVPNKPGNSSGSSTRTTLNANSEPFVPKGALLPTPGSTVEMENTTRTQYQPKLVILKRDKNPDSKSSHSSSANKSVPVQKSYEEREADYQRARERILGSAVPQPLIPTPPLLDPPTTLQSLRTETSPLKPQGQPEVPLLRQPQGPSVDGSKGFSRTKR